MIKNLPSFDLQDFAPYRLAAAAEKLSQGFASQYRDEFGISVTEWRVLAHLAQAGDVSVRDIESGVGLEKSKVSRAATRLQAAGYIAKRINRNDKRLLQLSLSAEGHSLMEKLIPRAIAFQAQLEALLGEHVEGFNAALDIITSEGD